MFVDSWDGLVVHDIRYVAGLLGGKGHGSTFGHIETHLRDNSTLMELIDVSRQNFMVPWRADLPVNKTIPSVTCIDVPTYRSLCGSAAFSPQRRHFFSLVSCGKAGCKIVISTGSMAAICNSTLSKGQRALKVVLLNSSYLKTWV